MLDERASRANHCGGGERSLPSWYNAPFHNHKRVQDILAKDYHYLILLPPYSPDFSPIEKTFGAMKKRRQGMPPETTTDQLIMSY